MSRGMRFRADPGSARSPGDPGPNAQKLSSRRARVRLKSRDHPLRKPAHGARDARVFEVAETHLAEKMVNASRAQLGDLLGHVVRAAEQSAGTECILNPRRLGMVGIG